MIVNKPIRRLYKCGSHKYYMVGEGIIYDTVKNFGRKILTKIVPIMKDKAIDIAKTEIPKVIMNKSKNILRRLLKKTPERSVNTSQITPSVPATLSESSRRIINSLLKPNDPLMLGEGLKVL